MSRKGNIDHFFRERLENFSPKPNSNIWQNIETQLPNQTGSFFEHSALNTVAQKSMVFKALSGMAATLVGGLLVYNVYLSQNVIDDISSELTDKDAVILQLQNEITSLKEENNKQQEELIAIKSAPPPKKEIQYVPLSSGNGGEVLASTLGKAENESEPPLDEVIPASDQNEYIPSCELIEDSVLRLLPNKTGLLSVLNNSRAENQIFYRNQKYNIRPLTRRHALSLVSHHGYLSSSNSGSNAEIAHSGTAISWQYKFGSRMYVAAGLGWMLKVDALDQNDVNFICETGDCEGRVENESDAYYTTVNATSQVDGEHRVGVHLRDENEYINIPIELRYMFSKNTSVLTSIFLGITYHAHIRRSIKGFRNDLLNELDIKPATKKGDDLSYKFGIELDYPINPLVSVYARPSIFIYSRSRRIWSLGIGTRITL